MKYNCFEDLPIWKAAIELAKRVYNLTRNNYFLSRVAFESVRHPPKTVKSIKLMIIKNFLMTSPDFHSTHFCFAGCDGSAERNGGLRREHIESASARVN